MFEELILSFLAKHYRDAAHSIFSPSGSAMWLQCSGSLVPNLLAADEAGIDAATGTVAHEVGEEWLKTGERPDHRVGEIVQVVEGKTIFDIEITDSMLDYVEEYVDWCINLPGVHYVEQKVFFSKLTPIPQQGGTADHFVCEPNHLTITDLKFGEGVQVYAALDTEDPRSIIHKDGSFVINGNSQAMLYALGVFYEWDWLYEFERVTIRIAQPRRDHMDVWETTRSELLKFARFAKERARAAWRLNAPLSPSEKGCRWCKVKASCPAFAKIADDISKSCFGDIGDEVTSESAASVIEEIEVGLFDPTLEKPILLSTKDMAKLLPFRGMFENWFSEIETELEQRASEGEKIPGRKLVEARTNRVFSDEGEVIARLAEAGVHWTSLYSMKFTSPAQAEELLQKKYGFKAKAAAEFIEPVVNKPPGKPTLVLESDRRPEFVPPADEVFDDLDDDL
jgi:hypothetical protein